MIINTIESVLFLIVLIPLAVIAFIRIEYAVYLMFIGHTYLKKHRDDPKVMNQFKEIPGTRDGDKEFRKFIFENASFYLKSIVLLVMVLIHGVVLLFAFGLYYLLGSIF